MQLTQTGALVSYMRIRLCVAQFAVRLKWQRRRRNAGKVPRRAKNRLSPASSLHKSIELLPPVNGGRSRT